jgi:hypothetical protein
LFSIFNMLEKLRSFSMFSIFKILHLISMYTILKMTYTFASTAPRTTTFTLVFSIDSPVSGFFLHVHERPPSALWVVNSGSLVMLVFLHVHELQRSVLRLTD